MDDFRRDFKIIIKTYNKYAGEDPASAIILTTNLENMLSDKFVDTDIIKIYLKNIIKEIELGDMFVNNILILINDIINLANKHEIYEISNTFTYIHDTIEGYYYPYNGDYDF